MKHNRVTDFFFVAALLMTLAGGRWGAFARMGWTLLPMLFMLNLRYAVYSLFFFAAFFHPTGFFPDLWFSIKHFQLAAFWALIATLITGGLRGTLYQLYDEIVLSRPLHFWLGIVAFGIISAAYFHSGVKAYRTVANLALTIVVIVYLFGMIRGRMDIVRKGLLYLTCGAGVKVVIGIMNEFTHLNWIDLNLVHNNHIGIMCAMLLFWALTGYFFAVHSEQRILYFSAVVLLFSGLVLSCSRTAWFSFAVAFLIYAYRHVRFQQKYGNAVLMRAGLRAHAPLILGVLFAFGLVMCDARIQDFVVTRVVVLYQVFSPEAWRYALADHQNFGFLGILRLQQIYEVGDILRISPLVGTGYTHEVTDFHCFYLMLLGGGGIISLMLFFGFVGTLFAQLYKRYIQEKNVEWHVLTNGVLPAFIVWLIASLLENMFLQYFIWMTIGMLSFLAYQTSETGRYPVPLSENFDYDETSVERSDSSW